MLSAPCVGYQEIGEEGQGYNKRCRPGHVKESECEREREGERKREWGYTKIERGIGIWRDIITYEATETELERCDDKQKETKR